MRGKMWYICNVIVQSYTIPIIKIILCALLIIFLINRKKAARYYAKTTKQVSKNLKKGSVKVSFGIGSMYSAAKSVFKRVFR